MGANHSAKNGDEEHLTETEIKLIVSIWELIPDKEVFGKDIMIR